MADKKFIDEINEEIPVENDTLVLSVSQFNNLINSPFSIKDIKSFSDSFNNFLYGLSGVYFLGLPSQFITLVMDETFNNKLTISYSGFLFLLTELLNCNPNDEYGWNNLLTELLSSAEGKEVWDLIRERIVGFSNISNETELKKEFPFFYNRIYKDQKDEASKFKSFKYSYMAAKNNPRELKRLKRLSGLKDFSDEEVERFYNTLVMFQNFDVFIEKSTLFFLALVDDKNRKKITEWIANNSLELKLKYTDMKSVLLYVIYNHICSSELNAKNGNEYASQLEFIIAEKMLQKYNKEYPNDNTVISFNSVSLTTLNSSTTEEQKIKYNLEQANKDFDNLINKYPFLKRNIILPKIDKSLSFDENSQKRYDFIANILSKTINEEKEHGAKDVTEEVNNKLEELRDEIKSGNITEKEINKKKIIIKKIEMVLKEIKPITVHKANSDMGNKMDKSKVFNNYYAYYYPNGMVALDRVDGYGALYIMPVHIYIEARYKKNLTEVRNIPGVKYISHKREKWLEDAKKYLEEGSEWLTEEEIKEEMITASTDFPFTLEKLEKMKAELETEGKFTKSMAKAIKNKAQEIKDLEKIDTELRNEKHEFTSDDKSYEELQNEEVKDDYIDPDESFIDSYKADQQGKRKGKYSDAVRRETKRRAMDSHGDYCCELCDTKSMDAGAFHYHHVIPLSEGGVDNIYNTVCLCPGCHNYVHSNKLVSSDMYRMLMAIKGHLLEDRKEYLPEFLEMVKEKYPIDSKDKEDYKKNKEQIDYNFAIQWNNDSRIIK